MNRLSDFAARQTRETIEHDARGSSPPERERPHELFLSSRTDPWPTDALDRVARRPRYPCLNLLGGEAVCGAVPATHYARGHEARYGHVCTACFDSFDEAERALYVPACVDLGTVLDSSSPEAAGT